MLWSVSIWNNKNKFWINNNCFSISSKNDNNNDYYYYICKCLEKLFKSYGIGSVQQTLKTSLFKNLQIPIPKTQELIDEWVNKISKPYNEKQEKQARFDELELIIKEKIKDVQENEDCDEVTFEDIFDIKTGKLFESIADAAKASGLNAKHLAQCLLGKYKNKTNLRYVK